MHTRISLGDDLHIKDLLIDEVHQEGFMIVHPHNKVSFPPDPQRNIVLTIGVLTLFFTIWVSGCWKSPPLPQGTIPGARRWLILGARWCPGA